MSALSQLGRRDYVSESGLASLLKELKELGQLPEQTSRASIKRARDQALTDLSAQYGDLMKMKKIPLENGEGELSVSYLDPIATLVTCLEQCALFRAYMSSCLQKVAPRYDQPWGIALYSDEISPGNQLRHLNKRKIQTIYWTFVQYGSAGLSNEHLWFTLCSVRSVEVSKVGGLTVLWRHLIDTFFHPHNLRFGLPLPMIAPDMILFADVSLMVSDEVALKSSIENKGAAGTLPCMFCRNVCSRGLDEHDVGGVLVPITCTDPARFSQHNNATVTALIQHLQSEKPKLSQMEFAKLEQSLGYNLEPNGLLCHPELGHQMIEKVPSKHDV